MDFKSLPPQKIKQLAASQKVYLSHHSLQSLDGIQKLKSITHLSLQNNKLQSVEELQRVTNPKLIECLSVKGNTQIERHPDYISRILELFPNLKMLDGVNLVKDPTYKQQARVGMNLSRSLIPFIYRLDKIMF